MATELPITRKRGDTRRHVFTIKDSTGAVVDISGWTAFSMAVDPSPQPSDALGNVDNLTGAFSTDGTDGRVYFVPSGAVDVGAYFYDAQALDSNSELITFAQGSYGITQDVDKA